MMQQALEMVWDFRRKYGQWWATPLTNDALRCSFCEAAEVLDAWLRLSRPEDARNHRRDGNILDELADTAIMLLTALGPDYEFRPTNTIFRGSEGENTLDWIAGAVGNALASFRRWYLLHQKHGSANEHIWQEPVLFALGFIENYPGIDLLPMIQERLDRILCKHVPSEHVLGSDRKRMMEGKWK